MANPPDRPPEGPTASLKKDLRRPEAYESFARTRGVEFVETHISWVFLLDDDVIKLKKPVDLGFLDFRTEEQRRSACEAEVRLNRRLAPHVYLDVVAVRRGEDGRATLGGSGAVIDWAVHMARLRDAARADVLLAAGALDASAIDAIARKVASFHASCRSDEGTARFGSTEVIESNLQENFAQTQDVLGKYLRSEDADEVQRWQRSFLRGHASSFEKRVAQQRVRDGHGDLRLEHVYLEGDRVTVLDCIEFNERFRFADVCADIAFLSMDLAGHGRVDLAERFLASYAREADDFDLYGVVDFYESYRAYVRGKIAAMLADDPSVDEATRRRAAQEARRYFLLALSADRRSLLLPAVVAVGGIIGSGKSTMAERIAEGMSAPIVDADRTRKAMLGVEPRQRLEELAWKGAYDRRVTERVYDEVFRRADVVLGSGRPVVLDASFRAASMRNAARELAVRHGLPFRFIECRAPAEVCRARLADREKRGGVSDGRVAIFEAFVKEFEPVGELPPGDHIVLDTTLPVETSLEALRSQLEMWPRAFVG
jgi:aminoglycoside phosphotransferase family enzyme/predicted kinase